MEAYFVFDRETNNIIGDPLGYFTEQSALENTKLSYFKSLNIPYFLFSTPSEERLVYYTKLNTRIDTWKFDFDKWTEKIFNPLLKTKYKIVKRKFKIVFTDDL